MTQTPDSHPADSLRGIDLRRTGPGRFEARNRRGGTIPVGSGDDDDFTPVELLLAAIAGCSAIDVDAITGKHAEPETLDVRAEGSKVNDEGGHHLVDLKLSFTVAFPDGEAGDKARERVTRSIEQSRDRLCTVGRTVQLGAGIEYVEV